MKRLLAASLLILAVAPRPASGVEGIEEVLRELNTTRSVVGTADIKSYPGIFRAYLDLTPPPRPVGPEFNLSTIHPGMSEWARVSGWAESSSGAADAILATEDKTLFGLPYGRAGVESEFRSVDLVADIAHDGSLRDNRFPYLEAIDSLAAYATAECYRRLETGRTDEAMDLAVATSFMLRQCCDREFLAEQLHSIQLLTAWLANVRDMMRLYRDKISAEKLEETAREKLPHLRPDRQRLFMPEGDRVVSEALIREVFTDRGQPDREKFASTFAAIQSQDAPLTRMGAARRWNKIAEVHDSLDASLDRLQLVYDDWWRRWRVEAYDPILSIESQFARTNPVRFAAVIYSMQNIEELFEVRNVLMTSVYGTAMAAGIDGYRQRFGTYPEHTEALYATFVRKRSDTDPFDLEFAPFKYRVLSSRFSVDTPSGRFWIDPGEAILYSKGQDHQDGRGSEHTNDGLTGDIVLWPPPKAMLRQQGVIR